MLEYARNRPTIASRQSSPNTLLVVIAAHVALVAVVMSIKMDLPNKLRQQPIIVDLIPEQVAPPPAPAPESKPQPHPQSAPVPQPHPQVPTPPLADPQLDSGATLSDPGPTLGGGGVSSLPQLPPLNPVPVRHDARLLTPSSELKPPYPASKLFSGEEAVLNLRLTIDARGRVIAVEPLGRADRDFLEAARRYLNAHWRYQPATEDGRAVGSTMAITLRFELDG